MNAPREPIAGLLIIDKPLRLSSMSVCSVVRGKLVAGGAPRRVKVGHGGTLDPLATGVLVVLAGRATRLCNRVMAGEKVYTARVDLARVSESCDLERPTEIVADASRAPTEAQVRAALAGFVGEIAQTPPAHSAMKVGGRRSYHLARQGEATPLAPRAVRVHEIDLLAYDWPEVSVRIRCGKGFYVRSFARDLGTALGLGGVLTALRRERVGPFDIADAVTLEELPNPLSPADLRPIPASLG